MSSISRRRGGKVQVVGVPSGRSTQLLLPPDGRAREHLTVRFVGDPAEVTFRVLELTALVRPIREEFASEKQQFYIQNH
jgi:hypothetical protein